MPRLVVPILCKLLEDSRAVSSSPCSGRMRGAFSATSRLSGEMATPSPCTRSTSWVNAQGSRTTPFPMIESLPGRTTPEGSRLSLYVNLLKKKRGGGGGASSPPPHHPPHHP